MATMMVEDDSDNNVDGDGATGNKVDDDGNSPSGDDIDKEDGDDDNDGNSDGAMGSGATGYDDAKNGNRRQQ